MDLQLEDRSCLVTGASRGIGRGIAKVLAAEGCRVAVVARRAALLDELAAEIEAAGARRPLVLAEDLAADGATSRIRDRVLAEFGGLDVLVNNAGSSRPVPWNATEEQWFEGMRLNFELDVECYDRTLAKRLEEMVERRVAASRLLRRGDLEARPLPLRLRDGVARLFAPYL